MFWVAYRVNDRTTEGQWADRVREFSTEREAVRFVGACHMYDNMEVVDYSNEIDTANYRY